MAIPGGKDRAGGPELLCRKRLAMPARRRKGHYERPLVQYRPPFALTVLAAVAFAGRTTFNAFSPDAMLWGGVWRFAYMPYEACRENGWCRWPLVSYQTP